MRIGLVVRYNGYAHKTWGFLDDDPENAGGMLVRLSAPEFPKAFRQEHGMDEIDLLFVRYCAVPDTSGEHGWVATEEFSLDAFAGG